MDCPDCGTPCEGEEIEFMWLAYECQNCGLGWQGPMFECQWFDDTREV